MARKKTKRLTDLELEIMQTLWDAHPEPLTVRDVIGRMAERGGKQLAYTTVQTMLNILVRKGALRSKPGPGRALQYRVGLSRADATSSMTADFVERLFGGRAEPLLSHLIEHDSLGRDELEALKRAIESQLDDDDEPADDGGER